MAHGRRVGEPDEEHPFLGVSDSTEGQARTCRHGNTVYPPDLSGCGECFTAAYDWAVRARKMEEKNPRRV